MARGLLAVLALVLAGSLATSAAPPSAAADAATCSEFVGFSETAQWFEGGFESAVDGSKWQLRWVSGGDLTYWSQGGAAGWTQPVESACAANSATPDRVILNSTFAGYLDPTLSLFAWQYQDRVIENAHARYPSAAIYVMPILGGPSQVLCPFPIVDPAQTQPYVRASWNHPWLADAAAYALADHDEARMAPIVQVDQCSDFKDWPGHLADAAVSRIAAKVAAAMLARFGGAPAPTPTPSPTPTASPTPAPTATASPSSTPTPAPLVVSFDDLAPNARFCCPPLSGTYPANLITWAPGQWVLSPPYDCATGGLCSTSISFPSGPHSGSFDWITNNVLVSIDAYNGGTGSSTITLSCAGNAAVTTTVGAHVLRTIPTGWLVPCVTVAATSSNGWDTNFDNLAYR